MGAKNFILFISLLVALSIINAQTVTINCNFQISGDNYDCLLNQLFIADNEAQTFVIQGQHQPNRNNAGVTRVIITNSLLPFVIPQFFTTFPNLQQYHFTDSLTVITRVQANIFQAATNLVEITIARTGGVLLNANSFSGATALRRLILTSNRLTEIPNNLLLGLNSIESVDFSANEIQGISELFFRGQTNLTNVNFNNNNFTRLPNTLLQTNVNLITFSAQTNHIDAIGNRFLFGLDSLNNLMLTGNICISQDFPNIGGAGGPTKESVNTALQLCFSNYRPGADWRTYDLQIRGNFRLFDEDDNLLLGNHRNLKVKVRV